MNYSSSLLISWVLVLLSLLTGCGGQSEPPTAVGQFEQFLNLDTQRLAINLSGTAETQSPVYLSKGYFTYIADSETLARILEHNDFKEASEFNQTIQAIDCSLSQFPTDFTYWTDESITITEKQCYMGIFFPYVHYLLYEPSTSSVQHFVTGMRD